MHNVAPEKLDQIDRELNARGVPLVLRPLKAFHEISRGGAGGSSSSDAFDQIADWYARKYGAKALWDATIGQQPVLIRGMVYFAKIPFTDKNAVLRVTDQIEDIPQDLASSLTEDEIKYLCLTCAGAFEDYAPLYNLQTFPHLLSAQQWELVNRAMFDLKAAVTVLKDGEDTQGAVFHSHQAAEKFQKTALLRYGLDPGFVRKVGHDLRRANSLLIERHSKFRYLRRAVSILQLPSMEIRYAEVGCSLVDAIAAFSAARYTCGFIAQQWQLDAERGGPDIAFQPGRYYRDYAGRTFKCISLESRPDGTRWAKMAILAHDAVLFKVDAVASLNANCGFFYIPLTDPQKIADLEARYNSLIAPSLKSEG